MTDLYPSEEGYISDGYVIGYCKCQAAIELHEVVYIHGTAVSGTISVAPAASDADGFAVALKAGAANDYIPVCFHGVVKLVAGDTLTVGDQLINDSLGTYVLPMPDTTATNATIFRGLNNTGSRLRVGLALQNGAASGDELLVLVGRVI
jgi:hypothetical protein